MQSDDPPFLEVGTEVSGRFKGAFCEAVIKDLVKLVRIKVVYSEGNSAYLKDSDIVSGELKIGSTVTVGTSQADPKARTATVLSVRDCSIYTLDFDEGDERKLKRSQVFLKGAKYFEGSVTLDASPLTNPECKTNIGLIKDDVKRSRPGSVQSSEPSLSGYASDPEKSLASKVVIRQRQSSQTRDAPPNDLPLKVEKTPKKAKGKEPVAKDSPYKLGSVMCIFEDRDKKKWFPGMIVSPRAQKSIQLKGKDEFLVKSFLDGKYTSVHKRLLNQFDVDKAKGEKASSVKAGVDKALLYVENDELPPHWDRDLLLRDDVSSSDESLPSSSDEDDGKPSEDKDRFVAYLYKFMDERGTPMNRAPTLAGQDLDLYRLYRVVQSLGGYNRVNSNSAWKTVLDKLKLSKGSTATPTGVKSAYNRYLNSFDAFYRKLGSMMEEFSRTSRTRQSQRSAIPAMDRVKHDSGTGKGGGAKKSGDPGDTKRKNQPPSNAASTSHATSPSAMQQAKRKMTASWLNRARKVLGRMPGRVERRSASLPANTIAGQSDGTRTTSKTSAASAASEWRNIEVDPLTGITTAQMVRIKYGPRNQKRLYPAKILRVEQKGLNGVIRFYVHYYGWNVKWDEYVPRNHIVVNKEKTSGTSDAPVPPVPRRLKVLTSDTSFQNFQRSLSESASPETGKLSSQIPEPEECIEEDEFSEADLRSYRNSLKFTPKYDLPGAAEDFCADFTSECQTRARTATPTTRSSKRLKLAAAEAEARERALNKSRGSEAGDTKRIASGNATPAYSGCASEMGDFEVLSPSDPQFDATDLTANKTSAQRTKPARRRKRKYSHMVGGSNTKRGGRTPKHQADSDDDQQSSKKEIHSPNVNSIAYLKAKIIQEMAQENPPQPSRFNFTTIDPELKGEELIQVLQQRLSEIKECYHEVKGQLNLVEKKRKQAVERRKEKERLDAKLASETQEKVKESGPDDCQPVEDQTSSTLDKNSTASKGVDEAQKELQTSNSRESIELT